MRHNLPIKYAVTCFIVCISIFTASKGQAATTCQDFPNPPRRVCESGIPSNFIDITAIYSPNEQKQSQWCWAASISMVFKYYGHPISQKRIVSEAYGGPVNMPAQPWTMLNMLNRTWVDDNGKTFTSSSSPGSTDTISAVNDLAVGMPLIVGTLGHAMVLTSLEYAAFYQMTPWGPQLGTVNITNSTVRDPWPGKGRRHLTFQEWSNINFAVQIRVNNDDTDTADSGS